MIKYVLSLFLVLVTLTVMGQKKSVVNLIQSQSSEGVKINGRDVFKVYKGVFKQDFSTMRSDSAYFYPQENAFDAFGHVNITQGDTLNIYSDKLNYNGNTKVAILTDNVRMIDRDAILTTNFLTYNTATRIGTYTGGGKLVNKDNTLTSKNGYYFARSRDAYFRYNVVLVTPDALIKTDTLRYSTATRIAYFYGPTNIYDTKDKKDTLYTENGTYNTVSEQAFFGKKNLYKQGTKTMKGDSLFYDRIKGYGRAIKHVTFNDREQKITLKGDLATYFKAEERTIVTQDPYVIIVTEEKDTTAKADTAAVKPVAKDNTAKPAKPVVKPAAPAAPAGTAPVKALAMPQIKPLAKDTAIKVKPPAGKVKQDSIYISADTLETQILTYKNLKIMQETQRLARIRDTSVKTTAPAAKAKPSKFLTLKRPGMDTDSSFLRRDYFGKPKPVTDTTAKAKAGAPKKEVEKEIVVPELNTNSKIILSDTARIRIVIAHHHAKLFKSDLQAKADSMFYSYSDSTLRCYVAPIIWTQGSQLSGDTIYMQMKNKKLDNLDMFPSAFIVNIEKSDSTHFNQVAGKRMKGFFKNDKLDRMFITGNAESIYFARDSIKVTDMQRSLSSLMRIYFKNNSASNIYFITKPDHRYGPLSKFPEDERILKGFIWKPKERPFSKESIIPSYNRKYNPAPVRTGPVKKTGADTSSAPKDIMPADSLFNDSTESSLKTDTGLSGKPLPAIKTGKDTVANKTLPADKTQKNTPAAKATPLIKSQKDTVLNKTSPIAKPKTDTAANKALPVVKPKKDTVAVKL